MMVTLIVSCHVNDSTVYYVITYCQVILFSATVLYFYDLHPMSATKDSEYGISSREMILRKRWIFIKGTFWESFRKEVLLVH